MRTFFSRRDIIKQLAVLTLMLDTMVPSRALGAPSPDGSVLHVGDPGSLTDVRGNVWTIKNWGISRGAFHLNHSPIGWSGVALAIYNSGQIYAHFADGTWGVWNGSTWVPHLDPSLLNFIGMYNPVWQASQMDAWDGLLNLPLKTLTWVATTTVEGPGWDNFEASAQWIADNYDPARRLVLGVGFFPPWEGATIEEAATGAYNAHYTAVAKSIASKWPAAIVRPGWEFQGGWFAWGWPLAADQANYPSNFILAWQQLAGAFRAVSPYFTFALNPNIDNTWNGMDWSACYAGDEWVDYVGFDLYDEAVENQPDPTNRWNAFYQPALDELAQLAIGWNKPVCAPEWGAGEQGDNPVFVQKFAEWYKAQPLRGFQCYWNGAASPYHSRLTDYPLQMAEYIKQFKA